MEPRLTKWGVFLAGLALYIAVQTTFVADSLWNRSLPPEPDDSFTYLLKTVQMEECFYQNCPALEDLRKQLSATASDPKTSWQRSLVEGRFFVVYHPLFSLIVLGVHKLGFDFATAYKIVWTAGPAFFGIAFGLFLASLWGIGPAGIALGLLAWKVFPNNGLHYVVPSNLAMIIAVCVWARLIITRGHAPWSLVLGTLSMVLMHPIGRIFGLLSLAIALLPYGIPRNWKIRTSILLSFAVIVAAFVLPGFIDNPLMTFSPEPSPGDKSYLHGVGNSIVFIMTELTRFESALFGTLVLFSAIAVFGYLTLSETRKALLAKIAVVFVLFLGISLFYVLPAHPGDLFLRLWIPLVVLLFGAVGQALWFTSKKSLSLLKELLGQQKNLAPLRLPGSWPIILFTVLVTFCLQSMILGAEGMLATAEYMKERQRLSFNVEQPKLVLAESTPKDRVLYEGLILQQFYFVHGAMERGAIYYPLIKGTSVEEQWLHSPGLRFAVVYNPLVALPPFRGTDEEQWWISSPELRFSPLSNPRKSFQMTREGSLPAAWVQSLIISPKEAPTSGDLRIWIDNPGGNQQIEVRPVLGSAGTRLDEAIKAHIPAKFSGWMTIDLTNQVNAKSFQIDFPIGDPKFTIGGLVFGEGRLRWPWAQKADLRVVPRLPNRQPFTVSFDPTKCYS